MPLTRDQILARRAELPRESVDIPALGGEILIRVLTLGEVNEVQKLTTGPVDLYPKLAAMACVNEDGSPLFVGEDIKLLTSLPWDAMDMIARAVMRISHLGDDDKDPKASPQSNGSRLA